MDLSSRRWPHWPTQAADAVGDGGKGADGVRTVAVLE